MNDHNARMPSPQSAAYDASDLLTAIPGMLGFIPERSLIFTLIDGDRCASMTARTDLLFADDGSLDEVSVDDIDRIASVGAAYAPVAVVAVVVDDRYPMTDLRYRAILSSVHAAFGGSGGISVGLVASELVAGARWHTSWLAPDAAVSIRGAETLGPGRRPLADPYASTAALERALRTGRRILERRADVADQLQPRSHCDDAQCGANARAAPARHGPPGTADANDARYVLALLRTRQRSARIDCAELSQLDAALVNVHVRDLLFGTAVTAERDCAGELWTELACRLRGRGAAAAATLLAFHHYVIGEGVYCGAALEAAHRADPTYRMAELLSAALAHGMAPARVCELADTAFALAARLGVDLGHG